MIDGMLEILSVDYMPMNHMVSVCMCVCVFYAGDLGLAARGHCVCMYYTQLCMYAYTCMHTYIHINTCICAHSNG
jgi:hypothetical protein